MAMLSRRGFLTGAGALATFALSGEPWRGRAQARLRFSDHPFKLGIASGDPQPDGFVLWTRLAPDPLDGGGMTADPVTVEWQVAVDDRMSRVVQQGAATASATLA